MASYETYLGVGIDASGAQQGAAQVDAAMNKMAAAAKKAAKETAYYEDELKKAGFAIKAFASAAAALAVREIGNYTQAMSNAKAMTGASAEDMARLAVVVRDLGASTAFSATQVADAAATFGQAGFSIDKIMGTLPAALDLAAAASVDMATAADIMAGAMASFGMNADQSTKAADILGAVATTVKTDIRGLGEALKAIGPSAQQVGWTLEDTSAILGVMAQKNLEGSMSGTALKATIGSLVAPSRVAKQEIKNLHMSLNELNPNMVTGKQLFENLARSGIDAEGVFRIFGREAANGVFAVISSMRELDRVRGVIDKASGSVKKMAETKLDNLWGDVEQLTGALSELALKTGDAGAEGAMRKFIKAATEGVDWLSKLTVEATKSKDTFWLLQSSVELLAFSVGTLVAFQLATWLIGVSKAVYAAYTASALFSASLLGLPTTAVVAALAGLSLAVYKIATNWDYVGEVGYDTIASMGNSVKRFTAGAIVEIGHLMDIISNRAEYVVELVASVSKQAFYSITNQTQKFMGEQTRFAGYAKKAWSDMWMGDAERENLIDELVGKKAEAQINRGGINLFRAMMDGFKSGAIESGVKDFIAPMIGAIPEFSGKQIEPKAGSGFSANSSGLSAMKPEREKPLYDNDGMMSAAIAGLGIMKKEVDTIVATWKQQGDAKQKYMEGVKKQTEAEQKRLELTQLYGANVAEIDKQMQLFNATREYGLEVGSKEYENLKNQIKAQKDAADGIKKLTEKREEDDAKLKKITESQKQWNNQLTYAFKDAIMNSKNLGDALSNLANRVQDMLVNKALDSLLGGIFSSMKFAKGAAFSAGGVTAFASGGVVNSPTMFPMRGGVGLMGEAGSEAIMPLTRTSNGDLGVKAVGAGTVVNTSINISVSGGTKEQNDDAGRKVSAAVKQAIDDSVISVILREKRPGGVLNAA